MESENLYTYAFLKTPDFVLQLPQGSTNSLIQIDGHGLSAIVEPGISLESFQDDDEKIVKMAIDHDRVICDIFRQITVLPLRFGTYFTSTENLLTHLESYEQEYLNKLEKINGKTEFILKLIPRMLEEDSPVLESGRNYFLAKKQHYQQQKNFILAQASEKEILINFISNINQIPIIIQEKGEEVRIYLLVNYQNKTLLLEQFLTWQETCPRWNLSLGEGIPPYHFI